MRVLRRPTINENLANRQPTVSVQISLILSIMAYFLLHIAILNCQAEYLSVRTRSACFKSHVLRILKFITSHVCDRDDHPSNLGATFIKVALLRSLVSLRQNGFLEL